MISLRAGWNTMHRDVPVVAVIGGGFSGAAVAMQLIRRVERPIAIVMFDDHDALGRGVAYAVSGPHLLLNVPAGNLGWDPEHPDGFCRWLSKTGRCDEARRFLPREWFGDYIESALSDATSDARSSVEFSHVRDRVVSVRERRAGVCIKTRAGDVTSADYVILALGNGPIRRSEALEACVGDHRLLTNPWDLDRLRLLSRRRRVLLVGTGLTMCDTAVSLARHAFDGQLIAVSRHGLTPRPHGPAAPAAHAAWAASLGGREILPLLRAIRARADVHDWRSVIDSLRPHLPRLWSSLATSERRRFVSRLATYWDVHRHRCPRETDAAIRTLRERGRLRIIAGRIAGARPRRRAIEVTLHGTGALGFDGVVLCTGPEPDPRRWADPLMDELLREGLIVPDETGLGIDTDETGFAIGRSAGVSPWLSTLGPLRRGALWESTAVPELRRQAADLAAALAQRLNAPDSTRCGSIRQEIKA